MSFLRGLLFDNLGLKLVALLLALVVYLHVFTERPATMVIAFPIQITDLADTLALAGEVPDAVEAELEGTGKQFIRLWLTEPRLRISLAGVGPGRLRRVLTEGDLPLIASDRLIVHRLVGPDTLELRIERKPAGVIAAAPRTPPRMAGHERGALRPGEPERGEREDDGVGGHAGDGRLGWVGRDPARPRRGMDTAGRMPSEVLGDPQRQTPAATGATDGAGFDRSLAARRTARDPQPAGHPSA